MVTNVRPKWTKHILVERLWFQGVGVTCLARLADGVHGVPALDARACGPFGTPHGRGRVGVAGGHLVKG